MPYEPTTLSGDKYKTFKKEGWYRMTAKKVVPGKSSGGYSQLRIVSEISDGEYAGCQSWYFMIIPTLKKAYALMTDEKGKERIDRNKPTYWTRRVGWTLWVFDIVLDKDNREAENIKAMQSLDNLDKMVSTIEGKHFVAYLKPKEYEKDVTDDDGKTVTETRISAEMVEIRGIDYKPEEGFVGDSTTGAPPVQQGGPETAQGASEENVELDPDIDLEEDEDFFVD